MVSHAKSNGAVTDPNLWSDSGGNRDQTTILTCFQQDNAPDKPVIIALCALGTSIMTYDFGNKNLMNYCAKTNK